MSEFRIKVGVELDASELETKLKGLEDERKISIQLDMDKVNSQLKELKNSFKNTFKLDSSFLSDLKKITDALEKINKVNLNDSSGGGKSSSTVSKLINDYKELYNITEKLQKQIAKGGLGEEGLKRTQNQINDITNMMNRLKGEMSDKELAVIDIFEGKKSASSLAEFNNYLNKIESQIDSVKSAMNGIDKSFLDNSSLRDLYKVSTTIDQLRASLKDDILLEIEVGSALDTLRQASETVKRLQNEAKQASKESEKLAKSLEKNATKQHSEEMSKLVNEYKELGNMYSKLQGQMAKGGLDKGSLDRTISQVTELQSKMKKLYDSMDEGAKQKIDLFNASQSNKALVDMNNYLNKIESTATSLQNKLKSAFSSFDNSFVDSGKLDLISRKLEGIQTKAREGINLDFKDIGDIINDLNKLSTTINDLAKVENLASEFDRISGSIKDLGGDTEKFASTLKDLENTATTLDGSFDRAFDGASSSLKRMRSDVEGATKSLKNMNTGIRKIWDDFSGNFAQFTLGEIAGDFIADGIRTLSRGLRDTIVETDSAITSLNKVYDEKLSGDKLNDYLNQVTQVAKSTGKSSVDVIQGTAKAVQSGIDDINQALVYAKQSAILSNVGDIDQGQADDMLASIMSAYGGVENALKPVREQVQGMGKDYNTLTKFMDLANYAGNNFAVSTADVGEALRNSASTLNASGVSMEQSVAMAVAMNEILQDAGRSGNALKSISAGMTGLTASAKDGSIQLSKAGKTMKEIAGIDVWNEQTGEIKNMYEVMDELSLKWNDLSEAERATLGTSIAGKTQLTAFNALLSNWDTAKQLVQEYKQGLTIGSAEKENAQYLDSIAGKWNAIKENMKSVVTNVISSDSVKSVLDVIEKITAKIAELSTTDLGKNLLGIGTLATGLLAASGALKALTGMNSAIKSLSSISTITSSLTGIGASASGAVGGVSGLATALGGIGGATAGIAAATVALVALASAVGDSTNTLSTLQDSLGNIGTVISTVCEVINGSLQLTLGTIFENFKGLGKVIGAVLEGNFSEIDDIIRETNANIKSNIAEGLSDFTGTTNNALRIMRDSTQEQMSGVADVFNTVFKDLPKTTSESLDSTTETIVSKISGMKQNELEVLKGMGGEVGALLFDGINAGMSPDQMAEKIKSNLSTALKAGLLNEGEIAPLVETFNNQLEKCVVDSNTGFKQAGTELFNQMKEGLQSGDWSDAFQDATKGMDNWTNEMLDKQKSFGDAWATVMDGIHEGMDNKEMYDKMLSNFEEYSKSLEGGAEEAIDNLRKEQQEAHKVLTETAEGTGEIAKKTKEELQLAFESLDMETKVNLKTEFAGVEESQLANIYDILQRFPDEIQTKLKGEGFKETLIEAESVQDFLEKLPEEKLVEIMSNTQFVGGLTPEELQIAVDRLPDEKVVELLSSTKFVGALTPEQLAIFLNTLPEETRADVVSNLIQKGKMTPEQLAQSLSTLPPETVALLVLEMKESGKYTPEKLNEILLSLPPEVRSTVEAIIKEYGTLENYKQHIDDIPAEKNTTVDITTGETTGLEKGKEAENLKDKNTTVDIGTGDTTGLEKGKEAENLKDKNVKVDVSEGETGGLEKGKEVDKLKDKDVKVNIKQGETSFLDGLGAWLKSKATENEQTVTIKAKVGSVDTSTITNIKISPINITATVTGTDAVNSLKTAVSGLASKNVAISASVSGADNVSTLKNAVSNLQGKSITVSASTSGTVQVNALKTAIDNLAGKSVAVNANVSGTDKVNELKASIDNLAAKIVAVKAEVSGTDDVNALSSAIDDVESKSVEVSASVSGTASVNALASAIGSVKSKTVSVKVNRSIVTTEEGKKGSIEPNKPINIPAYTPRLTPSLNTDMNMLSSAMASDVAPINVPVTASASSRIGTLSTSQILPSLNFDISRFKNLEEALERLGNQMDLLDEKSENTFGAKKIDLLNQQIDLLWQQRAIQQQLAEGETREVHQLMNALRYDGFTFDAEGNITNYNDMLLAMEQNVESLKNRYDQLNDVSEKNESAVKNAQRAYDDANERLSKTKKYLDEYFATFNSEILEANKKIEEYDNQVKEIQKTIRELNNERIQIQIDSVSDTIDFLDARIEGVTDNQSKINDLNEQNRLYREQKELIEQLIRQMGAQQWTMDSSSDEYTEFTSKIKELNAQLWELESSINKNSGTIADITLEDARSRIESLEKDLKYLEARAENVGGANKNKSLSEQITLYEQQRVAISELIKELTIQAKMLVNQRDKYQDIMFEIKDLETEWEEINNSIKDAQDELEKFQKEMALLSTDSKLTDIENQFNRIEHNLDILNEKMEYAWGSDKIKLMTEELELLNQQLEIQKDKVELNNSKLGIYQEGLKKYGAIFDSEGNMTNYTSLMDEFKDSGDLERIIELSEEYIDIQNEVRDSAKGYYELENAIKDLYNEQLEITKDIEDEITEIYEKECERREKELEDFYDKQIELLNKEKDAYKKMREQQNYEKTVQEQTDEIASLQKQLEVAKKDDSVAGLKRQKELLEEIEEAQKELQETTQDKIDSDFEENIDKEIERLENEQDDLINELNERFSETNIGKLVAESMKSGMIEINGEVKTLQDALLGAINDGAEGYSAMASIVKNELVSNLNVALETMKDITSVYQGLNLQDFGKISTNINGAQSAMQQSSVNNKTITIGDTIINVSGSVDDVTLERIEEMIKEENEKMLDKITNNL